MDFRNRTVVLCVGGGIAAYKACDVARLIVKAHGTVRVAMTPAATRFVGPLTFQALSGAPVLVDLLDTASEATYGHLQLARAADLVLVAPATGDLLARIRAGMADDAVTTTVLAATCPRLLAPLDLAGRRVLVTAGPTREPIDPVRFISNPSSGKMGYAIAAVAARRGAEVTLVSGPTELPDPPGVEVVRVETAEEMARAVEAEAPAMDLFVGAAAVSDYRPRAAAPHKIKKGEGDETLVLQRTPDILAGLGQRLAGRPGAPVLVGFAAETEEVIARAREKLKGKRCDLVVANKVGSPGAGFRSDTNRVALVSAEELAEIEGPKERVAEAILDWILPVLDGRRPRQA